MSQNKKMTLEEFKKKNEMNKGNSNTDQVQNDHMEGRGDSLWCKYWDWVWEKTEEEPPKNRLKISTGVQR